MQEFQDAQEWKGREWWWRSRARSSSEGDRPGFVGGRRHGRGRGLVAQRILSLSSRRTSMAVVPVTHTRVLWDEGVAAKLAPGGGEGLRPFRA